MGFFFFFCITSGRCCAIFTLLRFPKWNYNGSIQFDHSGKPNFQRVLQWFCQSGVESVYGHGASWCVHVFLSFFYFFGLAECSSFSELLLSSVLFFSLNISAISICSLCASYILRNQRCHSHTEKLKRSRHWSFSPILSTKGHIWLPSDLHQSTNHPQGLARCAVTKLIKVSFFAKSDKNLLLCS